jgi:hypothetical protein
MIVSFFDARRPEGGHALRLLPDPYLKDLA